MLSLAPFVLKLRLSLDQQRQSSPSCFEYRCDGMRCVCAELIAAALHKCASSSRSSSWAWQSPMALVETCVDTSWPQFLKLGCLH